MLEPIYQAIAVYQPFPYALIANLRHDTTYPREFANIPRNRQYFSNNRARIKLGISRNILRYQLEVFRCLRRPFYFEVHLSSFLSTSSWLSTPSFSARSTPLWIFSTT